MTRHIIITESPVLGIPEIDSLFAEKAHISRGAEVIKDILGGGDRTDEEYNETVKLGDCPVAKVVNGRMFVISSLLIQHPVNA